MPKWKRDQPASGGPAGGEGVPGYHDLQRIGRGGFSVVYRARQDQLDRVVAVKVLSVEFIDSHVRRRFLREVQLTSRLTGHPNVVTVLDSGMTAAGRPYIAMEYFERGSLRDRLAAEGPLPVGDVLRIGVKVAGALAAAHHEGVLHRDVKPQNILVSRFGEPALADFGTARLTDALDVSARTEALTPYHAAPEILQGETPSTACDVYSLGSTLYQLLTGRPPYQSEDGGIAALLLRVLREDPPPIARPDVPPAVGGALLRAMAKSPTDRYGDAWEFAYALQRLQVELGLPVTELTNAPSLPTDEPALVPPAPAVVAPVVRAPAARAPVAPVAPAPVAAAPAVQDIAAAPGRAGVAATPPAVHAAMATTPPAGPGAPPLGEPLGLPARREAPRPIPIELPGEDPIGEPTGGTHEYTTRDRTTQPSIVRLAETEPAIGPEIGPGSMLRPPEAPPGQPRRGERRRWPVVAGVLLLAALAVGAPLVLAGRGGGGPRGGATTAAGDPAALGVPSGVPSSAGLAPTLAPGVTPTAALRPTNLRVTKDGGVSVVLHWDLPPAAASSSLLLQFGPADPGQHPAPLNAGVTTYTVTGLNPQTGYCFRVGPYITGTDGAIHIVWSDPTCIRGAVAQPTS